MDYTSPVNQGSEFSVRDRCKVPNTYLLFGWYSLLTNLTRNEGNGMCPETAYIWITVSPQSVSVSKVHISFLSNTQSFYLGGTCIKTEINLLLLSPVTQLCSQIILQWGQHTPLPHSGFKHNLNPTQINAWDKLVVMGCQIALCTCSSVISRKMSIKIQAAWLNQGFRSGDFKAFLNSQLPGHFKGSKDEIRAALI